MRRRTLVDVITTETTHNDKEIKVTLNVRLQLERIMIADAWEVYQKRFPDITKEGTFTVTGVAKCGENDEFDFNKGFHIAESRAQVKAYYKAARVFDEIVSWMWEQTDTLRMYVYNAIDCAEEGEKHIEELSE